MLSSDSKSGETDLSQSKKCYICSKKFSFRKKHVCRFCTNAVCSDHCQRAFRREGCQDSEPICDLCLQVEIKKSLENEIELDIKNLETELAQAKGVNDRLEREHFEKTSSVSRLENDLDALSSSYTLKIKDLENTLSSHYNDLKSIESDYNLTKSALDNAVSEESRKIEKITRTQQEIEELKTQMEKVDETKNNLNEQIDKINARLKGSLSIEELNTLICETCAAKAAEMNRVKLDHPYILENSTINLTFTDERQSILESVREYKEILATQNEKPDEPPACSVV